MEEKLAQTSSNCIKIVLFGPESTGKTTLAKQLAAHFKTQWVPEFMRTYLEQKWETSHNKIEKEDILPIAEGQMLSENSLTEVSKSMIFIDTNLLEIKTYCEYYYNGWCPPQIEKAIQKHQYNYYFLTDIDTPWEFDNLRDRPDDREEMFRTFETQLVKYKLPYSVLKGSKADRLASAITIVNTLIKQK